MKHLIKAEAAKHLGVTKQWMNYRTKKKGGVFPEYVSDCGKFVDVDNTMLLNYISKEKNIVSKKVARGRPPKHELDRKGIKQDPKKKPKKLKIENIEVEERVNIPKLKELSEKLEEIDMAILIQKSERAKCEQEIFKSKKMENELLASRNELVSRSFLGDTVYGYLDSLSKEIMQLPVQIIQEMRAGIEAGKSDIELIDDLRKPLTYAIQNTKKTITKRLKE